MSFPKTSFTFKKNENKKNCCRCLFLFFEDSAYMRYIDWYPHLFQILLQKSLPNKTAIHKYSKSQEKQFANIILCLLQTYHVNSSN